MYHFQLYGPNSPWYHTRLRPGTLEFLKKIEQIYELHICTFGARNYAHMICTFLDENGRLFSHRILSRDECLNATSKKDNLKALFPDDCGDSMVCIIDDREDVWNYAKNLIQVKPYHFFQNTGDINAPPNLAKKELDGEGVDFKKYVKLQKASKSKVQSPKTNDTFNSNEKKSKDENNQDTSKSNDEQIENDKQENESNQNETKVANEKEPDIEMKEKELEPIVKKSANVENLENNEKEDSNKKSDDSDVDMKEKVADLKSNSIKDEENSKEDEKKSETDVEIKENGSEKDDNSDKNDADDEKVRRLLFLFLNFEL